MTDLIEEAEAMAKMQTGKFITSRCCQACERQQIEDDLERGEVTFPIMILCPQCGNKRCPKATFHGNECTGSNEPGQLGSEYVAVERGGRIGKV